MSVRWLPVLAAIPILLAGLAAPTEAASPTEAATASQPVTGHPMGVRVVDGRGELFDRRTGERFVVRGTNYVFTPLPGGRRAAGIFHVRVFEEPQ